MRVHFKTILWILGLLLSINSPSTSSETPKKGNIESYFSTPKTPSNTTAKPNANKRPLSPQSPSQKSPSQKSPPYKKFHTSQSPNPKSPSQKSSPTKVWREKPSINLTFYNSGQGNCIVAENLAKNEVALVDCGSTESNDASRRVFNKPLIEKDNIIRDIKNNLINIKSNSGKIFVVVTHEDADHYNWLPDIFFLDNNTKGKKQLNTKLTPDKFIIASGNQQIVNNADLGSLLSAIDSIQPSTLRVTQLTGKDALRYLIQNSVLPEWIIPLAANYPGGQNNINVSDKNRRSIVLKIKNKTCSAILTGDATKVTTDYMISKANPSFTKQLPESIETTILLASHHGADGEGGDTCNDKPWIKRTNPKAVIVSSGYNQSYGHPRCSTLSRYLENASSISQTATKHFFSCYWGTFYKAASNEPFEKPPLEKKLFNGSQAIFNTFDSGDITVSFWSSDGTFSIKGKQGNELMPRTACVS